MGKIEKKIDALANLDEQIGIMRKKLARETYSRSQIEKKIRLNNLIEAGKLFEEAGILDNYDRDQILAFLKSLNGGNNHET